MAAWTIDRGRVLTKAEVLLVLKDQGRKAKRSKLTRRNLIIFRLATCCGLRRSELTQLRLSDINLGISPALRLPAAICKADCHGKRKGRTVPLTWDAGTLHDLTAWVAARRADGADDADLVVTTRHGRPIHGSAACRSYQNSCRVLGRPVSIHDGRHTFASHALHVGRNIVAVQSAMGHASLATTSIYAHLIEDETEQIGSLYE